MEGNLHYCAWERDAIKFRVWVKQRPQWTAIGETFDEALESLAEIIGAETGDGEPQFEFPEGRRGLMEGIEVLSVYVDGSCSGPAQQPGLFEGGYCGFCKNPIGKRTRIPRILYELPRSDGAVDFGGNLVFSEKFISQLSDGDLRFLDFLEVQSTKRSKRRFFELIGKSVGDFVARKGIPPDTGQCPVCGWKDISYTTDRWIRYLSCQDVPSPVPSCFAAGRDDSIVLCVTRARWKSLYDTAQIKKLRSDSVILLNEAFVERNPKLQLFQSPAQ